MSSDLRQRAHLRRALDAVDQVARECQADLQNRAAATLDTNPGPIGVGRMLAISRRVEALERIARELSDLLDERPIRPIPAPSPVATA